MKNQRLRKSSLRSGRRGRRFESCHSDHSSKKSTFSRGLADRPPGPRDAFLQRFSGRVHGRFGRAGRLVPRAWLVTRERRRFGLAGQIRGLPLRGLPLRGLPLRGLPPLMTGRMGRAQRNPSRSVPRVSFDWGALRSTHPTGTCYCLSPTLLQYHQSSVPLQPAFAPQARHSL